MSYATTYAVRRNQNLTRSHAAIQTGPITTLFMLVALVVLLSLIYLNQIGKNSIFSYKISALEQTQDKLNSQQQQLQINAARLQSISTIASSSAAHNMVPVASVSYAH